MEADLSIVDKGRDFPLMELREQMKPREINLNLLQEGLKGGKKTVRASAYEFLLRVLLALNEADDWTGRLIRRAYTYITIHHIFPKSRLKKTKFIDCFANITFVNEEVNKKISNKLPRVYLKEYEDSLNKHFIPLNESLWHEDRFEDFIKERIKLIHKAAKKLLPDITT